MRVLTKGDKERLQELIEVFEFQVDNSPNYGRPVTALLLAHDIRWLLEQTKENIRHKKVYDSNWWYLQGLENDINEHKEEISEYRRVIKNMKEEIEYALYSNKSKDDKIFYLENAIRFAEEALEHE